MYFKNKAILTMMFQVLHDLPCGHHSNLHAYTLLLSSDLVPNMPGIPISGPSYLLFILPVVSPPHPTPWLFTWIALSHHLVLCCAKSLQSCPTLFNPIDYRPPGFSVHGILQARILEWVVMPSSFGLHLKCQFTLS